MGPNDRVDPSDVEELVGEVEWNVKHGRWNALPAEAGLLTALDSPNAEVRDAAARIVRTGGKPAYPDATRKLP